MLNHTRLHSMVVGEDELLGCRNGEPSVVLGAWIKFSNPAKDVKLQAFEDAEHKRLWVSHLSLPVVAIIEEL